MWTAQNDQAIMSIISKYFIISNPHPNSRGNQFVDVVRHHWGGHCRSQRDLIRDLHWYTIAAFTTKPCQIKQI